MTPGTVSKLLSRFRTQRCAAGAKRFLWLPGTSFFLIGFRFASVPSFFGFSAFFFHPFLILKKKEKSPHRLFLAALFDNSC